MANKNSQSYTSRQKSVFKLKGEKMTYQFPEKECNEEKYSKYLENVGFRQCTEEDKAKMKEKFPYASNLGCLWYVYEGDLEIEDIKLSNTPLLITGNLTIKQPFIQVDENNGLMVFGKTTVQYMELAGYGYFFGGIEFEMLSLTIFGEDTEIHHPKGRLLYRESEDSVIKNMNKEDVEVFFDTMDYKFFGDVSKLLPKKYLFCHEVYELATFEEYKSYHGEDSDYDEYIEEMEIDVEVLEIFKAIQAGKKVFLD